MKIELFNNKLVLLKKNKMKINIDIGNIIKYTGHFYDNTSTFANLKYVRTLFIGVVENYRYNCEEGYTGIYVKPLYVWNINDLGWNKIINYKQPREKYFLYPHLLHLPEFYYHFQPLHYLHTCINVYLKDYDDIIVRTIELEHSFENASYDYPALKRRKDVIREELIRVALHPSRIAKWLEAGYFDDAY